MADKNLVWMKMYISYRHNRELNLLPKDVRCDFFYFYMIAKESDAEGLLALNNKIQTSEDLAWELRDTKENIKKSLDLLIKSGLMHNDGGYYISNFDDEQRVGGSSDIDDLKRQSDRLRQQKHREKIKGLMFKEEEQNKEKDENKEKEKEEEENKIKNKNKSVTRDITVTSQRDTVTLSNDPFSLEAETTETEYDESEFPF
jgi:hypothetical protein